MSVLNEFFVTRDFPTYGGEYIVCRPVMSLTYYFADATADIGGPVADAIEAYLELVPKGTLRSHKQANGEDGPLTTRTVTRDLNKLRASKTTQFEIRYHSGEPANVGEHGLLVVSDEIDPDLPDVANLLRFEFPPVQANSKNLGAFLDFVQSISATLPFQSGVAGYAIAYLGAFEFEAYQLLPGAIMRFLALDPSYTSAYLDMRNHTPDAHWLTLLGDTLLQQLGGRSALSGALSGAEILDLPHGVLVRAADVPPIGDVNRGAKDIGLLPDLARFMRPTRVNIEHMFNDEFDPAKWLRRFDERPSAPWENAG